MHSGNLLAVTGLYQVGQKALCNLSPVYGEGVPERFIRYIHRSSMPEFR